MADARSAAAWPAVRLREISKPVSRLVEVVPGQSYRTIGVKWWGEGAYERETIDGSKTAAHTLSIVRKDDLIINKIWVRHGSTAIVTDDVDGCAASGEFPTFELDLSKVLPRWIHWLTKTKQFWNLCDALSRGTSGKNRIKPELFLSIQIPLPALEEQRRIVSRIEAIAGKLQVVNQLRQQAVDLQQVVLETFVSRVFDGLASYPVARIDQLGLNSSNPIQIGPFGAQLHSDEFVDSGVPVLNVGNVWPDGLRLSNLDHVTPEKATQLSRYSLQTDDLLFARSGATLGKVCILPKDCDGWLMTGHLFRVRLDQSRVVPRYLFFALHGAKSIRTQVFEQVRGATRPGFNTTLLSQVEIPLPPINEQIRIVEQLNQMQAKLGELNKLQSQTAGELDALMPAVLDKAFKGEL